ncbi:MAG: BrnT family toxin [Thermoanaerobaculia bacterium]|nr:BrnT family toxin [Thermoanaerobaculia bacterium]
MKIRGVLWLESVVEKLEVKHGVVAAEVEEVFASVGLRVRKMSRGRFRGEDVYRALGTTVPGRHLAVFFIYKHSREALVLSARDMDAKERRSYGR